MKKLWLSIVCSFIYFASVNALAASNHYAIIIDAGSSGSRLHLFEYAKSLPMIPIPVIKDIYNINTTPGLSSYASNPSAAGPALQPLFTGVLQYLNQMGVNPNQVPVAVYGTAGMRLLPSDQQQAIYNSVTYFIHTHYKFPLNDANVKTISGQMEGLFDWLDVNYLSKTFLNPPTTLGSIDMGGASTQLAFATNDTSHPQNEMAVTINNHRYNVFIQSFLGLGQNSALSTMNTSPSSPSCYPLGYVFSGGVGNFNLPPCESIYTDIIASFQVTQNIIPLQGKFVGFSGIYFDFNFFNIVQTPTQTALNNQINAICYLSWADIRARYPDPTSFLSAYCANGAYLNQLLFETYGLRDGQLIVANKINGTGVDWTLGAMLYSLL